MIAFGVIVRFSATIASLALMNERNGTKSEYVMLSHTITMMDSKGDFLGLQN